MNLEDYVKRLVRMYPKYTNWSLHGKNGADSENEKGYWRGMADSVLGIVNDLKRKGLIEHTGLYGDDWPEEKPDLDTIALLAKPKLQLPIDYVEASWSLRKQAREQYVEEQKGLCAHCGQPLDGNPSEEVMLAEINWNLFPPRFMDYPVHLHHSHDTGMTIGAVHARCNAYLWQYEGE